MDLEKQAEWIAEKRHIVFAVCVPERYHRWISETFSTKVVDGTALDTDRELPPGTLVITNTDDISQVQLCKIKHFQARAEQQDLDVLFIYVTIKQLQYCSDHPYWILGSRTDAEVCCERLSYANSVLRSNGLRCVREKWLFRDTAFADGEPEEECYGQTSLWENANGDYVMVTVCLYRSHDERVDGIRVEGFHDDVFVTEGIIPVDTPHCDMEKEILYLAR